MKICDYDFEYKFSATKHLLLKSLLIQNSKICNISNPKAFQILFYSKKTTMPYSICILKPFPY